MIKYDDIKKEMDITGEYRLPIALIDRLCLTRQGNNLRYAYMFTVAVIIIILGYLCYMSLLVAVLVVGMLAYFKWIRKIRPGYILSILKYDKEVIAVRIKECDKEEARDLAYKVNNDIYLQRLTNSQKDTLLA